MILSALCDLHARLSKDPESGMPGHGYSVERISFAIILRKDGSYRFMDMRGKGEKNKLVARLMSVPEAPKRSSNVAPNYLWDKTEYVLGVASPKNVKDVGKYFAAFRALHEEVARQSDHPALRALCAFLDNWEPEKFREWEGQEDFLGQNCVFMWEPTGEFVHSMDDIPERNPSASADYEAVCLVSGKKAAVARTHPAIKGVWGGQVAGGSIVSFNCPAFISYDKVQSYNAPVSEKAAHAYSAALNYLLNRANKRCVQIGDASTVFWAEKSVPEENALFHLLFSGGAAEDKDGEQESTGSDDKKSALKVRSLLEGLRKGLPVEEALKDFTPETRFFILGLAPNAARVSIRFWLTTTFGTLADNIGRHVRDIAIVPQYDTQPAILGLWRLLVDVAIQGKSENIVSPMASAVARAMLAGERYPQSFYMAALNRIRSTKEVTYSRASIIKGCLVRNYSKEVSQMLDETRTDLPYCLGRLFAVLEKTQLDALGNINSTIRDKYIGSASATPKVVFPQLLRLAQHHISKSDYGFRSERVIESIMQHVKFFPANLTNEEQGEFFIGFYHQRVANYQKTVKEEE